MLLHHDKLLLPVRTQSFDRQKIVIFIVTMITNLHPAALSFVNVCIYIVGLSYYGLLILRPAGSVRRYVCVADGGFTIQSVVLLSIESISGPFHVKFICSYMH